MKYYLILAIVYFSTTASIVMLTRENGIMALQTAWLDTVSLAPIFGQIVLVLISVGVVITRLTKFGSMRTVAVSVFMAFIATLFFHSGFMLFKSSMPYIVPFYADPTFADWDKVLHGGWDAWEITHIMAEHLPMQVLTPFYLHVWVWPAICLPVFLVATDQDHGRVLRTMVLYGIAWVVVGNILALAGMSAGPVFYDRIYGGDRFADLITAMTMTPDNSGYFDLIQDDLWMAYSTSGQSIGSGISAFPSVHLSISMVAALYMWERKWWLGAIGSVFVMMILFLSVFSGYHYALDGYFSIIVMWVAWALMRRHARAPQAVSLTNGPMPAGKIA
jgi:hypothetical protein